MRKSTYYLRSKIREEIDPFRIERGYEKISQVARALIRIGLGAQKKTKDEGGVST